jgi:hypothetical protein
MTTIFFILSVIILFAIVNYNILILLLAVSPSIVTLFIKLKLQFSEGYDSLRLFVVTFFTSFSIYSLFKYIDHLKIAYYESDNLSFIWSLIFASIIALCFLFIVKHQPMPLKEYIKKYRNKNIKDSDLLKKEEVKSNLPYTQGYSNRHPKLKNFSTREIEAIIKKYQGKIVIDNISKNLLFDLFEGREISAKILIVVINIPKKVNYINGVNFLHELLLTENVVNPFSGKDFLDTEVTYLLDKHFTLQSSILDKPKKKINVIDLFHK